MSIYQQNRQTPNPYHEDANATPTPTHSNWPYSMIKPEPMEEEKNDSGINSGSDFHSSSPGSDHSQDVNHRFKPNPIATTTTTPTIPNASSAAFGAQTAYVVDPSPLTPPNSEPLVSPNSERYQEHSQHFTPCTTPDADHLKRLEMSLDKNNLTPSTLNENDNSDLEYDENIRVPKMNSHGKMKKFKCKQCKFVALTKIEFWEHSTVHIKEDKRLNCPHCPFVTEYKHHLEYHLRNHAGSKPFKCDKCDYSCVNKSMLNSHMKSHSNIYQYRCADCRYASKYCHSLKVHLRRYDHSPAMVLNPDGTPNPLPIIDVYGSRRGPKLKTQNARKPASPKRELEPVPAPDSVLTTPPTPPFPFDINQFLAQQPLQFLPNPQILQSLQQLFIKNQTEMLNHAESSNQSKDTDEDDEMDAEQEVLDLSRPGPSQVKSRRKGLAFKLKPTNSSENSDNDDELIANLNDFEKSSENPENIETKSDDTTNVCQYCNITFGDPVLYYMHVGYHGFDNPFKCNICGVENNDKVSFFLHIARFPH